MNQRSWFSPVLTLLLVFWHNNLLANPQAVKGIIDLRQVGHHGSFMVKLNGEWEFYGGRLIRPVTADSSHELAVNYTRVPSNWTLNSDPKVRAQRFGCAAYRLKVILPPGLNGSLAFDMPVFDSSYEIWVDGTLRAGNGITGTTPESSEPEYRREFFRIKPASDTLDIVINVSNFSHRRGGFWLPVRLGTFDAVEKHIANNWAAEWSVVTILIGFSLFFLFFYILSPKDRMMVFISIMALALATRPLFTSRFLIQNFFDPGWTWIVRGEYLGMYLALTGWTCFVACLYPSKIIKMVMKVNLVIYGIAALLTLFLPVKVFSFITFVYFPSVFFLIVYQMVMSFRGLLKRNYIDLLYFGGFCLLLFGTIHDLSVSSGVEYFSSGYILTYLIIVFIFIQAALLLYKWIHAFHEKEKLQAELEYMNRNLGILVNERTMELQNRTREIEEQNHMIAEKNRQLSDTINLKNRIFSLVAHDLRSPVVNILYMLNLLKEKDFREQYDTFMNSSIRYAQMVISLLENMLVWGRGQEDKIKYAPERRDLADIILTNLSIFKESADKKEITVNFSQAGSSFAYFDKDLLDIIIRNLLSNAVKYTPRGGKISISSKDRADSGEGIIVSVCDNGIGIPEKKRIAIFTSENIESTQGTEDEKGTGLGLKLCHELVLINNGTISVESREGEGACFIIHLPADADYQLRRPATGTSG